MIAFQRTVPCSDASRPASCTTRISTTQFRNFCDTEMHHTTHYNPSPLSFKLNTFIFWGPLGLVIFSYTEPGSRAKGSRNGPLSFVGNSTLLGV